MSRSERKLCTHPKTLNERLAYLCNKDKTENNLLELKWFGFVIQPDLFAFDKFGLGIGIVDSNGIIHAKFLNDFSRLVKFYRGLADVEFFKGCTELLDSAYNSKPYEEVKEIKVPQISITEPSYCQGLSINELLDQLFERVFEVNNGQ